MTRWHTLPRMSERGPGPRIASHDPASALDGRASNRSQDGDSRPLTPWNLDARTGRTREKPRPTPPPFLGKRTRTGPRHCRCTGYHRCLHGAKSSGRARKACRSPRSRRKAQAKWVPTEKKKKKNKKKKKKKKKKKIEHHRSNRMQRSGGVGTYITHQSAQRGNVLVHLLRGWSWMDCMNFPSCSR